MVLDFLLSSTNVIKWKAARKVVQVLCIWPESTLDIRQVVTKSKVNYTHTHTHTCLFLTLFHCASLQGYRAGVGILNASAYDKHSFRKEHSRT